VRIRTRTRIRPRGRHPPRSEKFKTDAGRTVYGGGGIAPDVVAGDTTPVPAELALQNALGRKIPQFRDAITDYAMSLKGSSIVTSPDFAVTDAMREAVWQGMRQRGIDIDRAIYGGAAPLVSRLISYDVARYVFGRPAEQRRIVQDDPIVQRAVELTAERRRRRTCSRAWARIRAVAASELPCRPRRHRNGLRVGRGSSGTIARPRPCRCRRRRQRSARPARGRVCVAARDKWQPAGHVRQRSHHHRDGPRCAAWRRTAPTGERGTEPWRCRTPRERRDRPSEASLLRVRGHAVGTMHPLVPSRIRSSRGRFATHGSVDGDLPAIAAATALAGRLGAHALTIPPGEKPRYHAAAVFAANFVVVAAWLSASSRRLAWKGRREPRRSGRGSRCVEPRVGQPA
jgi:hypothetical protein